MNSRLISAVVGLLAMLMCLAMAPVNTTCPMSGTPTKPGAVLTMNGVDIAFSCGGCLARFEKLDPAEQRTKLAAVGIDMPSAQEAPAGKPASFVDELILSRAYLLPNCPITGKSIDSAQKPARKIIDDREIVFCCMGCIEKFNADPAKYNTAITEKIISKQLPAYPLKNCLASGRPIDVKGTPTNAVFGNQLMRFCCGGCANFVQNDPVRLKKAVETLESAYISAQMADYPMKTCVISGEPLGDSTVNAVVGNRLVRVCCEVCEKKLNRNPRVYLAKIDRAFAAKADTSSKN